MSPISFSRKHGKRLLVAMAGVSVFAAGIAMLVLPGPAIIVMPIGLAILATEFDWARKLLLKVRARLPHLGNNPVPPRFAWLHALVENHIKHDHGAPQKPAKVGADPARPAEQEESAL